MEEVRVQEKLGSIQPVLRSVGPVDKDPQQAQDAPVEQINKQVEITSSDAAVISPSIQKELSRGSSGTKVSFSSASAEDASKGKINFIVFDKASGEVVRSFPDDGAKKVNDANKASIKSGALIDQKV